MLQAWQAGSSFKTGMGEIFAPVRLCTIAGVVGLAFFVSVLLKLVGRAEHGLRYAIFFTIIYRSWLVWEWVRIVSAPSAELLREIGKAYLRLHLLVRYISSIGICLSLTLSNSALGFSVGSWIQASLRTTTNFQVMACIFGAYSLFLSAVALWRTICKARQPPIVVTELVTSQFDD